MDLADVERDTGSGGISTDLVGESSMASPRWIPAPDFPPLSMQLLPEFSLEAKGAAKASFDRKCDSPQAPTTATVNYDQLSYGRLQ